MLMDRHRFNLSFLHFILWFIHFCKTICFWTVIPCKCMSLYPIFNLRI
ncbi:hypothetical protein HMPREF9141_2769 [Prevotella multiformis DSM 16608]|uniref:Uncharacterized protein n=1 Tax=Prevotella multiformis DSM 16608 TaxID=888743 RepID=F0FB02_9BACT|nr:hypothetical protein HMPREF9141_2769 [Prevotella multiformis DSM 16608]